MTPAQQRSLLAGTDCEVAFDKLTRQLHATDASIHRIEPLGVAFPRTAAQAASILRAAAEAGVSVIPRGAGTGLVGGALGDGLVVEFARHNRRIHSLDLERRTVRVGAGVVLDELNAFLRPHGLCFGPDVATSSRATLGGMIANNSSGSHVPVYGTTADHVRALEIVLADGRVVEIGLERAGLRDQARRIESLVDAHAKLIAEKMPPDLLKRWPGYGIDRFLREPGNLSHVLAGSEGTLAGIFSAELNVVPLPRERGVGLVFFDSVAEAMQATVELLPLRPAAIEHVDRVLLDQTKGQLAFQAARDLLDLDARPCESILIVEFFDEAVADRLAALAAKPLGLRTLILKSAAEAGLVWAMRKAGVALLTGCAGDAKPVTGIEDTAVRPAQLPEYVAGLRSLLDPLGLRACFYGHAASGLLHVRPVLDLHRGEDVRKLRRLMQEVSALVRQFKGSLAAEHGVGIARTEFLAEHLGPELLRVMQGVKDVFDPGNQFNPGKLLDNGRFKCDGDLRLSDAELRLPFTPVLAFAAKDLSFVRNLEQCNGCGGCRKEAPTMCPTFVATGEEVMSTRGRANIIRAALEQRFSPDPLRAAELEAALGHCLSCKACTTECPSNVNLALLKAELLHARWRRDGLPLRERLLGRVDLLGKLGCLAPGLANAALEWPLLRKLLARLAGLAPGRPLPRYAAERFDQWFAHRKPAFESPPQELGRADLPVGLDAQQRVPTAAQGLNAQRLALENSHSKKLRGKVFLWDDTFVRYHEPHIGRAAVAVLEAAGFEVALVAGRKCCGRPAFSQGDLDRAAALGRHNLNLMMTCDDEDPPASTERHRAAESSPAAAAPPSPLKGERAGVRGENAPPRPNLLASTKGSVTPPILFLEPSCWSMFVEDYRELKLPGAEAVGARCFLFEQFIDGLLSSEPEALTFRPASSDIAIHAHCHAKSLANPSFMARLARRLPGRNATLLETGCCGMAGAFGMLEEKQELSAKVAAPLLAKIGRLPAGATLVASGTSCRHQIEHLANTRALHMAELLAAALAK
jgi:FAD/FMN-containing dehydrogenase/Fe-S oxidoreductase